MYFMIRIQNNSLYDGARKGYQNFICLVILTFEEKEVTKNKLIACSKRFGLWPLRVAWRTDKVHSILIKCWLWIRIFGFPSRLYDLFQVS